MLQLIPQERFNKVGKILLGINSVDTHYILCKFNCDETVIGDNVHTNFSMVHRKKKLLFRWMQHYYFSLRSTVMLCQYCAANSNN